MKNKIITLMMVVLSLSTFGFDIPSRPNHLMNDYIGLLQPDQIQALETKLVAFDKKTSIQIAIVILDDLDGEDKQNVATEIGENWGVGQKGQNNGIVFLIVKYSKSAKEKLYEQRNGDWFIAPGYGLEAYITDYDAKSIGEAQFIPFAKEDKYYEGIDATLSTIITKLGEVGWQQREEFEAKRKAEVAESLRKFGNGLLMFLLFAVVLIGSGIVIHRARKAYLKKEEITRQRKLLKEEFLAKAERYKNLFKRLLTFDTSTYPTWAKNHHEDIMQLINTKIEPEANKERETFLTLFGNDLEPMRKSLSRFIQLTVNLETLIDGLDTNFKKIQEYQDTAPIAIARANRLLLELKNSITAKGKEGYKILEYQSKVQTFETGFLKIKQKFEDISRDDKEVCEESEKISSDISEVIESINAYLLSQKNTEVVLKRVNTAIEKLPEHKKNFQTMLDRLKKECPKENWKDLESNVELIPILETACISLKGQAMEKSTMTVQQFTQAEIIARQSEEKMNIILKHYHDIHLRQVEITTAEADFNHTLKAAEEEMQKAKNKISDSDVKQGAKNKLAESGQKMGEAQSKLGEQLVNWLIVISLLAAAKDLAVEASTMAENDINKAETARKQAAAAIISAAAVTLANKKRDDDTYYHSNPSPSNTGGGFSGFGGGSFGGGGAGGSW